MVGLTVLLAVLAVAGAIAGNKFLTKQANRLNDLKLQSEVLDRQRQDIVIANSNIKKFEELEAIAKQVVPQEKDQTKAVREIINLAAKSNISIGSITFPVSNLGQKATGNAKTNNATTTPNLTQVKPVSGLQGVYELEIIVKSATNGTTFSNLVTFLKHLESNQRTSQVSNLDINPDGKNPNKLTFSMTLKVYLKP